ncbi:MAG TPA: Asp-tRNA(Asn)/Glu-tRNA(Gln) amidotransferase subunit GatB [Candidatus Paceibacterota bacterium]|nr:Asp-tRNA(Asn)/Glu-tRNA(Gln) amidotransferase subunit GatB [Candidatus Paceibacterota bacterium]
MAEKYYYTVGLEVHAELKTETKMFCGCKNDPDEEKPNVNICPVCMAHPGALPVINKKAVEHVIRIGLALGGNIADFSEFDRKNYFYPDIPKGYQISQYKYPIVSGGKLAGFDITRVHLEEDTANNKHDRGDFSLIDFNRAGVPLSELVTEAHTFDSIDETAKAAGDFAREYQLLLQYLGASEANMEKGELRVEANISASRDRKKFGTKVEVKNLNSFKSAERAIKYELERMTKLLDAGKDAEIVQETRGWDEGKQATFSQRKKETSEDYRYFPDPDLPKLKLHEAFDLKKMKEELPELPEEVRKKLKEKIKNPELIEVFVQNTAQRELLEKMPTKYPEIAANYIVSSIPGGNIGATGPTELGMTMDMIGGGKVSSTAGKTLISIQISEGGDPDKIAKEKGLLQINDEGAIKPLVEKIISENPEVVATYKGGKENAIMSLVGKVIKESGGSANPQMVIEMLKNLLK